MTLPAVESLVQSGLRVSILCAPNLMPFWRRVGGIEHVYLCDENPYITADGIPKEHFQAAIIFPNSLRSALEVFLAGIPKRIGYRGHQRRWLLTEVVEKPARTKWQHQVHDYLHLVLNDYAPGTEPVLSPLTQTSRSHSDAYLIICPGAEYGPAKRWHPERFAQAADQIVKTRPMKVVLLGSQGDANSCQAVANAMETNCLNLAGKTTMDEFIDWIASAQLALCNDSGSMHLAAAFHTPTVAIFGSTEPRLTGPLSPSVNVLRHQVACSPCFLRDCPIDFRCMDSVTVDDVVTSAKALLLSS